MPFVPDSHRRRNHLFAAGGWRHTNIDYLAHQNRRKAQQSRQSSSRARLAGRMLRPHVRHMVATWPRFALLVITTVFSLRVNLRGAGSDSTTVRRKASLSEQITRRLARINCGQRANPITAGTVRQAFGSIVQMMKTACMSTVSTLPAQKSSDAGVTIPAI